MRAGKGKEGTSDFMSGRSCWWSSCKKSSTFFFFTVQFYVQLLAHYKPVSGERANALWLALFYDWHLGLIHGEKKWVPRACSINRLALCLPSKLYSNRWQSSCWQVNECIAYLALPVAGYLWDESCPVGRTVISARCACCKVKIVIN
jgi:hypothetical protein